MDDIDVRLAQDHELPDLARLRYEWVLANGEEDLGPVATYVHEAVQWFEQHRETHIAFVAVQDPHRVVGMTWLAIGDRVPAPGRIGRRSGDLQSCFVVPELRGQGVGRRLVEKLLVHAWELSLEHVTVHASTRSVPMYQRSGFEHSHELLWVAHPSS